MSKMNDTNLSVLNSRRPSIGASYTDVTSVSTPGGSILIQVNTEAAQAAFLSQVLRAQRQGRGVLPFFLGLSPQQMLHLGRSFLSDELWALIAEKAQTGARSLAWQRGELRQQLLDMRKGEWLDVKNLLVANCAGDSDLEIAMASIVAAGCLGGDHLWRDLGLDSRAELSELLSLFFPTLAAKNSGDMKWKKFFYKQLCEAEGGYVCRAPSCEECRAYDDCFGAEI